MSVTPQATPSYREVVDTNGRVYRVGESDRSILGRPRAWMVWLPWIAMMGVSVYEYGYSSAESTLEHAHGWTLTEAFWIASIWAVFQAGVAFPAGRLRETGKLSAKTGMLLGAVLSGLGFLSISHVSNPIVVILGYSVLGGATPDSSTRPVSTWSASGIRTTRARGRALSTADSPTAHCR